MLSRKSFRTTKANDKDAGKPVIPSGLLAAFENGIKSGQLVSKGNARLTVSERRQSGTITLSLLANIPCAPGIFARTSLASIRRNMRLEDLFFGHLGAEVLIAPKSLLFPTLGKAALQDAMETHSLPEPSRSITSRMYSPVVTWFRT
jgi:hypothetical protein